MATTTAIIVHYWLERTSHIARIVRDLHQGSVVPDKIIVFNNNKKIVLPAMPGVAVVNSTHNFHCPVRHAIGLIAGTELCLFVDDDVTLRRDGLEYLLTAHDIFPEAILGFEGRKLGSDKNAPYTSGHRVHNVAVPTSVDIVLGRVHFCKTSKLISAFATRQGIESSYGEDDIFLSLSNDAQNYVLPSKMIELGEKGVGLYHRANHYSLRNECCLGVLELRRRQDEQGISGRNG